MPRTRRIEFVETFFTVLSQMERKIVGLKLWPGQRRYFLNRCRKNNVTKSRRIGLSTVVQAAHVTDHLFDGGDNLIVGERFKTTSNVLSVARRFIYDARAAFPLLIPEILIDNSERIVFAHPMDRQAYKSIHAMTAGRSSTRSFGAARVHKTEMAHWFRDAETNAAVCGSDEGNMVEDEESTPLGRVNIFAQHALDVPGPNDYRKFVLDWRHNPNFTEEWATKKRTEIGAVLFAQEYACDFIQSGNPVFDSDSLGEGRDAISSESGIAFFEKIPKFMKGENPFGVGVDSVVGRVNGDNAVAYWEDSRTGRQIAEVRGRFAPDVFARKIHEISLLLPGRILVEDNGPGEATIRELGHLGTIGVRRWHTDGRTKTVLIHRWEKALRTREAEISSHRTLAEHMTFVYVHNENTNFTKLEALPPNHDDGVIAGALAHWAVTMPLAGVVE